MNPLVVHFLPSVILGVFRYDDEISSISMCPQDQREEAYETFTQGKLRFLPRNVEPSIRRQVTVADNYHSFQQSQTGLDRAIGKGVKSNKRAVEFFARHVGYFDNAIDGKKLATENQFANSENFLEIQFVKKVLAPLLNDAGLRAIQPQRQVGPYRLDFALTKSIAPKLAIEIDGFEKFQTRKDLDGFIERQNYITREKWTLFRYTYAQIMDRPNEVIRDLHSILRGVPEYRDFLEISVSQHTIFTQDGTPRAAGWGFVEIVNDFYRVQNCFVHIALHKSSAPKQINLSDNFSFDFPFVATAISELFKFLDAVTHLLDVDFDLPNVTVHTAANSSSDSTDIHYRVTVVPQNTTIDEVFDENAVRRLVHNVPTPPTLAECVKFRPNLTEDLDDDCIAGLDYFTDTIFRYTSGTKPFQNRVLHRIFNGNDVFGIAATGSGKSLCFWLPALLKPGLTIIIAPLRSLMRDQRLSLLRYGIACAEFINSDVETPLHRRFLEEAKLGYIRLLYVAPERLRIKSFLDELHILRDLIPINFLAIDEAHCISEWGHDFRPSYLKVPDLRAALITEGRNPPQLIALTATAGEKVTADIIKILKLEKQSGDVVRDKIADRKSFSYQIAAFESTANKTQAYQQILAETIPKALAFPSLDQLLAARNDYNEKSLGIVFCIFADPHGRSSIRDGIAHYLFETKNLIESGEVYEGNANGTLGTPVYQLEAFSKGRVRAFSSTPPRLCPRCFYYGFTKSGVIFDDLDEESDETGRKPLASPIAKVEPQVCSRCKERFDAGDAISPSGWDMLIRNNQTDFKNGRFDVLVATKGFGMGIDKSSVRFVIHTSMSGGIEAWYQEIGRAGRDDERAHIVLLVEPPTTDCRESLVKLPIKQPPCDYLSGCRYGKEALCDYGKQHAFIKRSYPGIEHDALRALRLLGKMLFTLNDGSQGWAKVPASNAHISRIELSLHRLMVLGVVEDYCITYGWPPHFDVKMHSVILAVDDPERREEIENHLRVARNRITLSVPAVKLRPLDQCSETILKLTAYPFLSWFYGAVYRGLGVLLNDRYSRILTMRYDMLWGLLDVVSTKSCRRLQILSPFQDKNFLPSDYRCGLCDICNPSLEGFPQVCNMPDMTSSSDLDAEFERLIAGHSFELRKMDELVDALAANFAVAKYRRAWSALEGNPTNLSALYFAVRFSPSHELAGTLKRLLLTANRTLALGQMVALYRNIYRRLRGQQNLLRGFLTVLNESGSSCDALSGWEFLAKEAAKKRIDGSDATSMMGECLEFFVFVDRELADSAQRLEDKVQYLENTLYA